MDLLILLPLETELRRTFVGASLFRFVQDDERRFRLVFDIDAGRLPLAVGLADRRPWIGIPPPPPRRRRRVAPRPAAFAAATARALEGGVLRGLERPGPDRVLRLEFADGQALVVELGGPVPNLVRLDAAGRVRGTAREPKSTRERLRVGEPYRFPVMPPDRLDPLGSQPEAIDTALDHALGEGLDLEQAIGRRLFGIGRDSARLLADESRRRRVGVGQVLHRRIETLRSGADAPVIAEVGERAVLWPWEPQEGSGRVRWDPPEGSARTIGRFHDALDRAERVAVRLRGLRTILGRQIRRLAQAEVKIERDRRGFTEPDRFRRFGEALLAGLRQARREGDVALVPDPYDPDGPTLRVPAPRRLALPEAAAAHFHSHRRALRGIEAAERRLRDVREKRERLLRIEREHREAEGDDGADALERAMLEAGLPVGLAVRPSSRSGGPAPPRLEGVRVYTSRDGWTILVGKGGRENQRLTFKLARPEDFWLHAQGRPGAHVVVRNPERLPRPPRDTLEDAAALAAWFSEARGEGAADVQWTRRKYVRKARQAPPGTVIVKRHESVRVRPGLPAIGPEEPSGG